MNSGSSLIRFHPHLTELQMRCAAAALIDTSDAPQPSGLSEDLDSSVIQRVRICALCSLFVQLVIDRFVFLH